MSKEKFVEMVMENLVSEYDLSADEVKQHRAAIEDACATESRVTESELVALFSGVDAVRTKDLAEKYPLLNALSLEIVSTLEDVEDEGAEGEEDDDDDDDDDEEDEEEEDGDDDDDEEDDA